MQTHKQKFFLSVNGEPDMILMQAAHAWDKYPGSEAVTIKTNVGLISTYVVEASAEFNPGITDRVRLVPYDVVVNCRTVERISKNPPYLISDVVMKDKVGLTPNDRAQMLQWLVQDNYGRQTIADNFGISREHVGQLLNTVKH